jgi:hypothetical protein
VPEREGQRAEQQSRGEKDRGVAARALVHPHCMRRSRTPPPPACGGPLPLPQGEREARLAKE